MRGTPLQPDYFTATIKGIESPKKIIEKGLYFKRYIHIPYEEKESTICVHDFGTFIHYVIDQVAFNNLIDVLEDVDLMVNTEDVEKIDSIEMDIGGQRFDKLYLGDAYCSFLEDTYQRGIEKLENGITKIPLNICPLLGESYLFINPSNVHKISINIRIKKGYEPILLENISLWGKAITLDVDTRKVMFNGIDTITQQTQYTGSEVIKNGKNKIRLNFNHPAYSLFFHFGPNHSEVIKHIRGVSLIMDNIEYYHGPVEFLTCNHDYVRINFQNGQTSPTLDSEYRNGFWNFSYMDNVVLTLDIEGLEEEKEYMVYPFLHSYQKMRYVSGMYGLTYSK